MKYTILRRLSQISILVLFILGNNFAFKAASENGILSGILKGNLSSSKLFGTINLSDPFATAQTLLASFSLGATAVIGALIVGAFYALIAPRLYCSWVCPINLLTDFAAWLRKKFGVHTKFLNVNRKARYVLAVLALVCSGAFGFAAFESVSFISLFARAVISLSASAFAIALLIVVFEIFAGDRTICSRLCPLGGFWAALSYFSIIRIRHEVDKCTMCGKCKMVCPEVQVLKMVGRENGRVSSECISCGRCIDVCDDDALNFSILGVKK